MILLASKYLLGHPPLRGMVEPKLFAGSRFLRQSMDGPTTSCPGKDNGRAASAWAVWWLRFCLVMSIRIMIPKMIVILIRLPTTVYQTTYVNETSLSYPCPYYCLVHLFELCYKLLSPFQPHWAGLPMEDASGENSEIFDTS
jgi:hypothetical protein